MPGMVNQQIDIEKKIYNQAVEEIKKREGRARISCSTEASIIRAENAVDEKLAEIKDMEAVEMTLAELKDTHKTYIVKVIEIVYFKDCDKQLGKEVISRIELKWQLCIHLQAREVYIIGLNKQEIYFHIREN